MKNKLDDDSNDALPRFHHHYLLQQRQQQIKIRDCLSDEVDSVRISSEEIEKAKPDVEHNDEKALVLASSGGDGATVEVAKRRRGRPPGSKNKPKPPVVITREAEQPAAMRPHVLEIPAGHDVANSLARFALRRNLGICVLGGSGAVANVTLRQPHFSGAAAAAAGASICFHGRLEILSISATFLPPAMSALSPGISGEMSISLSGPQGQVVGGTLMGPLVAAGTVVVVAAAFSNPTFHRLPVEDDVSVSVSLSGGGGAGGDVGESQENEQQHVHQQQDHRQRRHQVLAAATAALSAADSCGMSIYGGHLSPDVVWAPAARPPPPPPY